MLDLTEKALKRHKEDFVNKSVEEWMKQEDEKKNRSGNERKKENCGGDSKVVVEMGREDDEEREQVIEVTQNDKGENRQLIKIEKRPSPQLSSSTIATSSTAPSSSSSSSSPFSSSSISQVEQSALSIWKSKYTHCRLDGKMSQRARAETVNKFNNDASVRIMLISLK